MFPAESSDADAETSGREEHALKRRKHFLNFSTGFKRSKTQRKAADKVSSDGNLFEMSSCEICHGQRDVDGLRDTDREMLYSAAESLLDVSIQHDDWPVVFGRFRVPRVESRFEDEEDEAGGECGHNDMTVMNVESEGGRENNQKNDNEKEKKRRGRKKWKKKKKKKGLQPQLFYDVDTGYLVDGFRRADAVLVLQNTADPDVENVRIAFFMGLVRTGFQLEIELPVLKAHAHLQFVKVHAPDPLLVAYSDALGMRKFFKQSHLQFIPATFHLEETWIKYLRSQYTQPLRFSNFERSYVVWQLLTTHSFGEPANYFGLNRLIKNRIILDAYALHDGPFFNTFQKDFQKFNARQVLFLFWARPVKWLSRQPIHTVHEYYGPRVAFFFMFWEYYITALVFAAAWGLLLFCLYFVKDYEYLYSVRNKLCEELLRYNRSSFTSRRASLTNFLNSTHLANNTMCAECFDERMDHCPYTFSVDHCPNLQLLRFVDSPYMMVYSLGMTCFELMFLIIWRRIQSYHAWLWEEYHSPERQVIRLGDRPLRFETDPGMKKVRSKTFIKNVTLAVYKLAAVILAAILIANIIYLGFYYAYVSLRPYSTKLRPSGYEKLIMVPRVKNTKAFYFLFLIAISVQAILYMLEQVFYHVSLILTKLSDSRTHRQWEECFVMKYFFFSLSFVASPVMYFLVVKGALYHTPAGYKKAVLVIRIFNETFGLKMSSYLNDVLTHNCNPFSCFQHAVIVFVATICVRVVAVRSIAMIISHRKQVPVAVSSKEVSTCEREFSLAAYSERQLQDDYNTLFIQIALLFLFGPVFPLTAIIFLIINIFDMRLKANMYLTHHRRPVMCGAGGIGHWNKILVLVCLGAPFFHAIIINKTEIFKVHAYHKFNPTGNMTLRDFVMSSNFNLSNAVQKKIVNPINLLESLYPQNVTGQTAEMYIANHCRIDGFIEDTWIPPSRLEWPLNVFSLDDLTIGAHYLPAHFFIKLMKILFFLVYVNIMAFLAIVMWWYMPHCFDEVERIMMREVHIRRLYQMRLRFMPEDQLVMKLI